MHYNPGRPLEAAGVGVLAYNNKFLAYYKHKVANFKLLIEYTKKIKWCLLTSYMQINFVLVQSLNRYLRHL